MGRSLTPRALVLTTLALATSACAGKVTPENARLGDDSGAGGGSSDTGGGNGDSGSSNTGGRSSGGRAAAGGSSGASTGQGGTVTGSGGTSPNGTGGAPAGGGGAGAGQGGTAGGSGGTSPNGTGGAPAFCDPASAPDSCTRCVETNCCQEYSDCVDARCAGTTATGSDGELFCMVDCLTSGISGIGGSTSRAGCASTCQGSYPILAPTTQAVVTCMTRPISGDPSSQVCSVACFGGVVF